MTAAFACASLITAPATFSQEQPPGQKKRVLYVNSYHPGYTWSDQILEGLAGRLKPAFGEQLELQVEYLDGKRYSRQLEGGLGDILQSLFKTKYAGTRIDLLLVSDQDAYNFMRKVRNEVFPGVPMIFAGVEEPGELASNTTGILASTDIRGNVDLILQVLPSVKRLFVLSDDTVTGRINRDTFQRVTADVASRVEFVFLGTNPDDAPETLVQSMASLAPPSDAVFFLDYYSSPAGPVNPAVFIRDLASASKAPLFSHVDLFIYDGIIAGKMNSGLLQGQQMADTAVAILRGASTARLPLQQEVSVPTADFSALARFSIDAARFPEGTRFLNKPTSLLSSYKWHILATLGFLGLLAVLTVILAIMLKRQQRLEEEARLAAAHFQTLFQNVPTPVACYSFASGKIIGVNDRLTAALGYTLEDVPDIETWWSLAYPDPEYRRQRIRFWHEEIEKHRKTGEKIRTAEYRITCKNGAVKTMSLSAGIIEDWMIVSFFDVTERKKAEEELRTSEENLRITLNSIGDAVIATDMQGVITRMNPVAERLTGWHIAEAAGRKLEDVFVIVAVSDRKPAQNPVAQVIETGKAATLSAHTILLSRSGKEYRIADSAAPILADSGDIVGVILVFHDVTEELALQEQLAQSQKLDAIGQLASGVAHDFNNILSGMIGAAELLKVRIPAGDEASRNFLSLILESSQRAAGLVRQLMTFSTKRQIVS
ncbi:MAG TPA: PAS domain S-box protein, partial [Candidatus Ozemobacteraceae bacterium]|nr:PAS domain S-box protein [Candidatus Ozemobacteraceae bacterium]